MPSYILAVDLGGTQIRAALCDPSGQVFKRAARSTKAQEGLEAVLARINLTIEEAAEGIAKESIAGIGIGAPGPLDPMTGTILAAPNLPGWINVPLRNLVSARFGVRTFLGNDANLAGLAEAIYGAARGVSDVVYLTVSTGIGSGIIVNGRLLLGARGLAAEAGHTIIDPNGPQCSCGNNGCIESFAAGPAITRDVVARLKAGKSSKLTKLCGGDLSKVDTRLINDAAQAGDKLAVNAFQRAGSYLGLGIVNLLHMFNPRMVVLGGSVTKAGPLLFDPMWEMIRARAMPPYLEGLAIVPAALSDDVGLLGALALATTELKIERG
ncbi:MAG: ROK family protein [Anaerolineae bacterium]|jgi:glucokinase|nr:ROK family protein [Anaerolineae bacterium]